MLSTTKFSRWTALILPNVLHGWLMSDNNWGTTLDKLYHVRGSTQRSWSVGTNIFAQDDRHCCFLAWMWKTLYFV